MVEIVAVRTHSRTKHAGQDDLCIRGRYHVPKDLRDEVCPGASLGWIIASSKTNQRSVAHSVSYIEASNPHVSLLRCPRIQLPKIFW